MMTQEEVQKLADECDIVLGPIDQTNFQFVDEEGDELNILVPWKLNHILEELDKNNAVFIRRDASPVGAIIYDQLARLAQSNDCFDFMYMEDAECMLLVRKDLTIIDC